MIVSQTGFSGEKGYEIYLKDATLHAYVGLSRPLDWFAAIEQQDQVHARPAGRPRPRAGGCRRAAFCGRR